MSVVKMFVGTKKGGLSLTCDESRREWSTSNLHFKAWKVVKIVMDPRDRRIHATATHPVSGPSTHYSDDMGSNWNQSSLMTPVTNQ
jgi:hypothetical protein